MVQFGQLGLGTMEDVNQPAVVEALGSQRVVLVACGWRHSLALASGGDLFSWGRGVNGQLGHGSAVDL